MARQLKESPRAHNLIEPWFEFFVGGDFVKKTVVYEPHFVRLSHGRIEAMEGEGRYASCGRVDRIIAHARCFIPQEPLFCNLITINRRDIYLKSFLSLFGLEGNG